MNKLTNIKHYKKEFVKALYGRHGKESGLNPGVLWPRKEELAHLKQYEQTFSYNINELIAQNRDKKEQARKARQLREQEVYNNLQKLPGEFKVFFDKIEAKKKEREEWLREREALVEEVREILGYRAKPSDERFQAALLKREEDEVKAKKKEARLKRENSSLEEMLAVTKDLNNK